MKYTAKNIPLWQITTWDKHFNNVDRSWQPRTIKYNYLLSDELNAIKVDDGDVRILYTGKDVGCTTEELAGDNLCEGEIVSIPWGGIPTVKYYKGKFVTGDNRIATSNDTSILTNKYLYYYMQGKIKEIASYYRGASLKHPSMKDVLMMTISLPILEDQKRVCALFDVLESIIDRRKAEQEYLDKLIKARFVEMFGDPGTPGQRYPTDKLGNVATVQSSHRVFTTEFVEKGIPFFRGTEIGVLAEGGIPKDPFYITEKKYKELASDESKPMVGDLLMPSICNKGQVWMVDTENPFYYKDGRVLCISPNRDIFDSKYLQFYMKLRTEIEYPKLGSGSTFAEFKIFQLKELEVDLPPKYMQERFKNFIMQVDKSKAAVQKSLDETQLLFDSLMQKFFG